MRRITLAARFLVVMALTSGLPHAALAQDAGTPAAVAQPADVHVDSATGERWRWERPSGDMRRGLLPVSAWVAVLAGALVAVVAAILLVLRARVARRRHRR